MGEQRAATATVVFTDVVASTALHAELGEEGFDRFRHEHDGLLVPCIERHGGRVVKGEGDGLMAVFEAATDALAAAVAMQQAVERHDRAPDATAPFRIRIGLSVGDLTWEDGDCHGMPVVEAKRLEGSAQPGQVVCSDLVRLMARGRGGHQFRSLGELVLKGIPGGVGACEVEWSPLVEEPPAQLGLPPQLQRDWALDFVGRQGDIDAILSFAGSRRGLRFVWLMGEPGIGKTRLAAEVAARLHARAANVLFGRSDEELEVPFQPFVDALRAFAHATPDDALAEQLAQPVELARLLPELRDRLHGLGSPPPGSPDEERYRLFEAVRAWLAAAARERPVVLVLDDLHWATKPTLLLLGHLARSGDPADVIVMATLRDTERPPDLEALLDDMAASTSSLGVTLTGLPLECVAELVGEPRAVGIHTETDGNPFFVSALVGQPTAGVELPPDVHAAVHRRAARLSADAQVLLHVAALIGLDFDVRVLARASDREVVATLDLLEEARRGGLLEEAGPNLFRFSHALVRRAISDTVGDTRRAHVHLAIGEALEVLEPHRVDHLAHHFAEAARGDLARDRALDHLERAAEHAVSVLAYEEAVADYERMLPLLSDDIGRRGWTRLAMGVVERFAGDYGGAGTSFRYAGMDGLRVDSARLVAESAVAFLQTSGSLGISSEAAVERLQSAEASLTDEDVALRARVSAHLAQAHGYLGQWEEARRALSRAERLAELTDDLTARCDVVSAGCVTYQGPGQATRRLDCARRGLELAQQANLDEYVAHGLWNVAAFALEMGSMSESRAALQDGLRLATDLRHTFVLYILTTLRSVVELTTGDLVAAERTAEAADRLGTGIHGTDTSGAYGVQMFSIRREQGRLAEVAPLLAHARATSDPVWRPGWAAVTADLGMLDEAADQLAELVTDEAIDLPDDVRRPASLSYLADACCVVGDAGRAAVLYQAMLPYGDLTVGIPGIVCYGPATRYLGKLAMAIGETSTAEAHLVAGLDFCDRLESPLWRAHCQFDLGRLRGDRALLESARSTAGDLGMGGLLRDIERIGSTR